MHSIDKLAEFLRDARAGIAFTGAGISTESGIPDFRSPGGVWTKNQPIYFQDFIVTNPGDTPLLKMQMLSEDDLNLADMSDEEPVEADPRAV